MLFADVANGCYENILNIIVKWYGMNVNEYIKNYFCLNRHQTILGVYVNNFGKTSVVWWYTLQSIGPSGIALNHW